MLNLVVNCFDCYLQENGDCIVIIWEGDDVLQSKYIFYCELYCDVCCFVNMLLDLGIKKGDVVVIYMLMVLEVVVVMLVCVCIGVVYLVIFGGFLLEVVVGCIIDFSLWLVIIVDEGVCVGCSILLKKNVDDVLKNLNVISVEYVIVLKCIGSDIDW